MALWVLRWLRQLTGYGHLWRGHYLRLFGEEAPGNLNGATVRRMCRRSEIKAARWLEADVEDLQVGYPDTLCLQLGDSTVVSGDGQAVRVWSHATGRRIATLKGHTGEEGSWGARHCVGPGVAHQVLPPTGCPRVIKISGRF